MESLMKWICLTFSYPPLKILLDEKNALDCNFPFIHRGIRANG
jgi:hypothetical protein